MTLASGVNPVVGVEEGVGPGADALAAADRIIADFGEHRREAYFAHFTPEASFVFHNVAHRLESRAEYEELWRQWESSGFRVHSCTSSNRRLQLLGTVAVFSHDVETVSEIDGKSSTVHETETIVLALAGGTWLGVHEHLSVRVDHVSG